MLMDDSGFIPFTIRCIWFLRVAQGFMLLQMQEYVDALAAQLRGPTTHEQNSRIAELIQELCTLNMAIAMANPSAYTRFQSGRLDGKAVEPLQPGRDVWQCCLVKTSRDHASCSCPMYPTLLFTKVSYAIMSHHSALTNAPRCLTALQCSGTIGPDRLGAIAGSCGQ